MHHPALARFDGAGRQFAAWRRPASLLAAGLAFTIGTAALFPSCASASYQRFDLRWDGGPGQPVAVGHIVLDTDKLPVTALDIVDKPIGVGLPSPAVAELVITVSGSQNGDGTYGLADFGDVEFWTPGGIDLSRELVGQTMGNGHVFGDSPGEPAPWPPVSGHFGLTSRVRDSKTPSTYWWYILSVGDMKDPEFGCCQQLPLSSMLPVAVPEIGSGALLGMGLPGLLWISTLRRCRPVNRK